MNLKSIKTLFCSPIFELWGIPYIIPQYQEPRYIFESGNTQDWTYLGKYDGKTIYWYSGNLSDKKIIEKWIDKLEIIPNNPNEWCDVEYRKSNIEKYNEKKQKLKDAQQLKMAEENYEKELMLFENPEKCLEEARELFTTER